MVENDHHHLVASCTCLQRGQTISIKGFGNGGTDLVVGVYADYSKDDLRSA